MTRINNITMTTVRIALASIREPRTPADAVGLAASAVAEASRQGAIAICFPECFVPGYRWPERAAPAPDPAFLERAWAAVAEAARAGGITVILGTERRPRAACKSVRVSSIPMDRSRDGRTRDSSIRPRRRPIPGSEPNAACSPPGR